ncbi:MAG: type I-U CRISPR-associated protein Cas5/Cas6 [Deltaproteobacteria bacterium]|nr:type I-U CRISPR-associated protein Cas5/Cas6 [Deltaproteobacteria bacterium]
MSSGTVIEVELLSGRYHAHIWGESQFGMAGPEWPPSPWRLLRALASAWFSARPHPASEGERDALLEVLGRSPPPEMWLPRTSLHEVRFYQPVWLDGSPKRMPHHDHFAAPQGGVFWFRFGVALSEVHRSLLADLLGHIRYFGRSESRARLRLAEGAEPPAGVKPVMARDENSSSANVRYLRVLYPGSDFRATDLWSVRASGDKKKSGKAAGTEAHPPHLVDTLLDKKMPLPCGARWIEYAVPQTILVHEIRPPVQSPAPAPEINLSEVRFRLSRRIAIPIQQLVAVARAFREAVVGAHRRTAPGQNSRTLTGHEADGGVVRGHSHAYYLPRLAARGMNIDEIVVRVPAGKLTRAELDALLSVGRIHTSGRSYPITVLPEAVSANIASGVSARRWRSTTPFLLPLRHRRGNGLSVEQQTAECIERLCGRRPARLESLPGPRGLGSLISLLAHEYARDDRRLNGRPWRLTKRLGFWLELTFDEPITLPVAIGADAHFGAGQFSPVAERAKKEVET